MLKILADNDDELIKIAKARKKVFSYMGLATRGRKLVSGEFSTENAVKSGSAYLVIVSDEASNNTVKKFTNMCKFYDVPIYFFGAKEEIGRAIGKEYRASLAFLDKGLADATCEQLKIAMNCGGSSNVENENT